MERLGFHKIVLAIKFEMDRFAAIENWDLHFDDEEKC